MPVYETPWGKKTVTPSDDERNRIFIQMCDEHDEVMTKVGYYNAELIEEHEGLSVSTLDLVEWITSEDEAESKRMIRFIKSVINADKKQIKEYSIIANKIEETCNKLRGVNSDKKRETKDFYTAMYVDIYVDKLEERIKKNSQIISLAGRTQDGDTPVSLDFEKAKLVSIDSILEFRRGFAPCLWHDEKTPSMKYYKKNNKVHCFGCGKGGDAIDVIQKIKDCDIKEAVAFLTNA